MEEEIQTNISHNLETLTSDSCFSKDFYCDKDLKESTSTFPSHYRSPVLLCIKDEEDEDSVLCIKDEEDEDSVLCILGSRLESTGLSQTSCKEDFFMLLNAGGGASQEEVLSIEFKPDSCFEGGNLIRTDESIINGGDYPSIYQSTRSENFSYRFESLPPGDYFVDHYFAEIIYTNGPKGLRVFNVFLQGEKVVSELDIYSVVGANKPLQLLDARVSVGEDGVIALSFEGVHGSPVVSGICVRRAPKLPDPLIEPEYLTCNNCSTEIEIPLAQEIMVLEKKYMTSSNGGGLIHFLNLSKKNKRKTELDGEKKQHEGEICFMVMLHPGGPTRLYSEGAVSYADMVQSNAGTGAGSGSTGKAGSRGNSSQGNKPKTTLKWLKTRFNPNKPQLEFIVIAYQWTHGCFLEDEAGRARIIRHDIFQDWMLHGLWPPDDADQCYTDFNESQILNNEGFLAKLKQNWSSLKCEREDIEGHVRFWRNQWVGHGNKSGLTQRVYMEWALDLHSHHKRYLNNAMNIMKDSPSTSDSYDSEFRTNVLTMSTSEFEQALYQTLGAHPKIVWTTLGDRYILKELHIKISLSGECFEVVDMDNRGWPPSDVFIA